MLGPEFLDPPREFSLCPFWFWNDALDEGEIVRQMDDFQAHGVYAFVIHPRVGLPRDLGWMSDRLLDLIRFAVEQAAKRRMWVVLYDEGMYPSGSSSGQVVAENPAYRCRALVRRIPGEETRPDESLLYRDADVEVVDRPIDSVIRGLHYLDEGPEEDEPPAADLLNPEAMACFVRKSYDRYADVLGDHFGKTIKGIFTDEPSLLGRPRERDLVPGTTGIFEQVERLTGVDLQGRILELWDASSEARRIYDRGLRMRLEETYYAPLADWCQRHGLELMGHPEHPDELSPLRFFDVPGQDLVWRWVLPGPTAVEGPQSTQAKGAASAMVHGGRRRNSNECAGAYGHELTFQELKWLIDWCVVRGTNLFFPHAFYYSVRGSRHDERPPDVGPHAPWWPDFEAFATYCSRLCWLNTDCEHVCEVAILESDGRTPWEVAKLCFQNQIDFHYLARENLAEWSERYRFLLENERSDISDLPRTLAIESDPDLRVRHVRKADCDVFILHNEGERDLKLSLSGTFRRIDPMSLECQAIEGLLHLNPFELCLLAKPLQ